MMVATLIAIVGLLGIVDGSIARLVDRLIERFVE